MACSGFKTVTTVKCARIPESGGINAAIAAPFRARSL